MIGEDEIEFFGFLPVAFTTELQKDLEEELNNNNCINHSINNNCINNHSSNNNCINNNINNAINNNKISKDAFRQNIFIFNNFIIRNIFRFPVNFKLERKITDKCINNSEKKLLKKLNLLNLSLKNKQSELNKLYFEIKIQKIIFENYEKLLKSQNSILKENVSEINDLLVETEHLYSCFLNKNISSGMDKLMEYKYMKNEYYRNEKQKLEEIGFIEDLEELNKMI